MKAFYSFAKTQLSIEVFFFFADLYINDHTCKYVFYIFAAVPIHDPVTGDIQVKVIDDSTQKDIYTCSLCESTFLNVDEYLDHILLHNKEVSLRCTVGLVAKSSHVKTLVGENNTLTT